MPNAAAGRRLLTAVSVITLLAAAAIAVPLGSRILLRRADARLDAAFRAPARGAGTVLAVRYHDLPGPVAAELATRVEALAVDQVPSASPRSVDSDRDRVDGVGGYVRVRVAVPALDAEARERLRGRLAEVAGAVQSESGTAGALECLVLSAGTSP